MDDEQAARDVAAGRLVAAYGIYYLDNQPTLLRSAELQYFRVPRSLWASSSAHLKDAGFNALASYIPWGWHVPLAGQPDFSGHSHPQRDLLGFLHLVDQAGLVFIARPGPFVFAELLGFGYPDWLWVSTPQARAQGPRGRPAGSRRAPLYSLLHPAYLDQVALWYGQVSSALGPMISSPSSPVVAWQIDNETGLILAGQLGRLDFNPDTVGRYRAFLAETYQRDDLLAREWGQPAARIGTALPPRSLRSAGELADWQRFLEGLIADYLGRLRTIARACGIQLPVIVNDAADTVSPQNPRLKASAGDFYGFDSYTKSTGSRHTTDFPFASSQHPARFQPYAAPQRPLSCWELGAGWWDPRARVPPQATLQSLALAVARGVKGYNLYVAEDGRDANGHRYQFGALLGEAGALTERYQTVARFQEFVRHHEEELTASVEVTDPIAVLDYQPYSRFTPDDLLPVFGRPDPWRFLANRALLGFHALLVTAGYNPTFLDLEAVDDDARSLAAYPVAIFPSRGSLDLHTYGKLVVYALRGGSLITYPRPVNHQHDGTTFRTTFLWPAHPTEEQRLDRPALYTHLLRHWALGYHLLGARARIARQLPGALHLADLYEPVLAGQAAPLRGTTLDLPGGGAIRGDYLVTHYPDVAGTQTLLRHAGAIAGYRAQVRSGTSTVIGTILAGAYTTSRYFALDPSTRLALRHFARDLVQEQIPRQIEPEDHLEVEAVARLSPDGGCLLFVVNRLTAQQGTIHFPHPAALNLDPACTVEVLFSGAGSTARPAASGVTVQMQPDDVLVLRVR